MTPQEQEHAMRTLLILEDFKAFGTIGDEQAAAVANLTSGIPWFVPPLRGEEPTRDLLFVAALRAACASQFFGKFPKPGDILEQAIKIGGMVTSEQGHHSERRWVKQARKPTAGLPVSIAKLKSFPLPGEIAALADGIGQIGGPDND